MCRQKVNFNNQDYDRNLKKTPGGNTSTNKCASSFPTQEGKNKPMNNYWKENLPLN